MRAWILMALALLAFCRVQTFQTNIALWESATKVTPTFRAYMNYRNALISAGRWDDAIGLCGRLTATTDGPRAKRALALACLSPSP